MWILHNYNADQDEEQQKLKTICTFISPQDAKNFFDESTEIITEVDDDAFLKEIQANSDQKFTSEELKERLNSPENSEDLDVIERIGDD